MINYLAFVTSLLVAGVAAWFSVIGLATIFSGSYWPVIIMGGVLEIGKLVTAAFLHLNWKNLGFAMKGYLSASVLVLMLITSLGIFGFLAKANIEQNLQGDSYSLEMSIIDKRIASKESQLARLEDRLVGLDNIINTARPQDRNYIDGRQKKERTDIALAVDPIIDDIVQYNQDKLPLQRLQLEQDGEIGPIKYVAEMMYGEGAEDKIDNAARVLILFIIFAFDPLAVLLLVSSVGLLNRKVIPDEEGNVIVAASNINEFMEATGSPINTALEEAKAFRRKIFPRK
jgi:hypothetical protein|tara:strand:+ start:7262 stop:8119 length:858 start_codon:yes stop_codon:yes gene_type:complete